MVTKKRTRNGEFSNPFLVQEVRFNSTPAQSAFKVGYDDCDIALRGIGAALPVIIKNESEIAVINGSVEHLINSAFAEIRAESARIKKIAEDNGIELGKVGYTSALTFEVKVTSSKSGQYLQMLRELDSLIGLLHASWLAGFISDDQKAKMERQWRRKVLAVAAEIKNISIRAFRAAQLVKDAESGEDGEYDVGSTEEANAAASTAKATRPKKTTPKKTASTNEDSSPQVSPAESSSNQTSVEVVAA